VSDEDLMEDFSMFSNIFAVNNSKDKIQQLEQKLLEGRKWQEKGETTSKKRQKDALLEEDLEFERGIEKNIFISEEINMKYEDIIRNRIKDELFDDRTFEAFYLDKLRLNEQGFDTKGSTHLSLFS
jgi:U3 small nucleolar ribonucleoprotein component